MAPSLYFFLLLILPHSHAVSSHMCATYTRETCLFSPSINTATAKCKPAACTFDTTTDFACGFPETGSYTTTKIKKQCPDPTGDVKRTGAADCRSKGRCCGQHPGHYVLNPGNKTLLDGPNRYDYVPNAPVKCTYSQFTRGQVLFALQQLQGAPLAVVGDSMMRQVMLRLVMMLRGQQRLLDYKIHTHAQYFVCNEADAFRLSTNNPQVSNTTFDPEYLATMIRPFFGMEKGPGLTATKASLLRCTTPPQPLHFLMSPSFSNQSLMIPQYMDVMNSQDLKPLLLISVGYWEPEMVYPADYLAMLSGFRQQASKIFILGVATQYASADQKITYGQRNSFIRQWAANQGPPYYYIDYDAFIAVPPPKPPQPQYFAASRTEKHFMCWTGYNFQAIEKIKLTLDGSAQGAGPDGRPLSQIQQGVIERIQTQAGGECSDETNRNLWNVILSLVVPTTP